jgi:hypothetical protein
VVRVVCGGRTVYGVCAALELEPPRRAGAGVSLARRRTALDGARGRRSASTKKAVRSARCGSN